jgi:hypothetical protein
MAGAKIGKSKSMHLRIFEDFGANWSEIKQK